MKHKIVLLLLLAILVPPAANANKLQTVDIALTLPPDVVPKACASLPWKGTTAFWAGVVDERSDKTIGEQLQKGKPPIPIMSETPLEEVFSKYLKQLFASCGVSFVEQEKPDVLVLSAAIEKFYADSSKKFFTGKSNARSQIIIRQRRGAESSELMLCFELESKKLRSGKLKQIIETLNDLLKETIAGIPEQPAMKKLL